MWSDCFYITIRLYEMTLFPFTQAIFMIPTKPPPTFKHPEKWSSDMKDFVSKCLVKNPEERLSATSLLQVFL